jgi:putative redox protein
MVGVDSQGHSLISGSWLERTPEWSGIKSSDLLLLAASSCCMYDVVLIMNRQREPLEGLEITCSGKQLSAPPYTFTGMHLHFTAYGSVEAKKLERAINLSIDKYCSVINTLKPVVQITHDYEITPRQHPA